MLQRVPYEGGSGEGEHPRGGGPQLERELACYLLELTYDASPLVRAQVALGLSRISLAHPLLFQVSSSSVHGFLVSLAHPRLFQVSCERVPGLLAHSPSSR